MYEWSTKTSVHLSIHKSLFQRSLGRVRNKSVERISSFLYLSDTIIFSDYSTISRGALKESERHCMLLEIFYRHYCPRRYRLVCRHLTAVLIHLKYGPNIAASSSWEQSYTPSDMTYYSPETQHYIKGAQCRSVINTKILCYVDPLGFCVFLCESESRLQSCLLSEPLYILHCLKKNRLWNIF